jgi:hypothetical protein
VKPFRPAPQEERWIQVAARLGLRRDTPGMAERCGDWTAAPTLARCAFFALGALAAGLTAVIFNLSHVPAYLFIAGLGLVAAGEWLILKRHLFGAGIEEALDVAGWGLMTLQIADPFTDSSGVHSALLIALALGLVGLRLLNPLITTLSVLALSSAIDSLAAHHASALPVPIAAAFCFALAAIALTLGATEFRRPSYDRMLDWLIVVMPLAGYLCIAGKNAAGLTVQSLAQTPLARSIPLLILLTLGVAALMTGIRRRRHAPLLAFMVCAGCIAYELRNLTSVSIQVKLIAWGSVVILLTLALDWLLRTPRRGISSQRFKESEGGFDLLQLAGASALVPPSIQPTASPSPGPPFGARGGTGGGGGASGSY